MLEYRVSQKKCTLLADNGIKSLWPMFKSEMLICQSKAKLKRENLACENKISLRPKA